MVRPLADNDITNDDIFGGGCGGVSFERGAQRPQEQVTVDPAELLARLHHPGRAPAQRHLPIAPALDVRAAITTNTDH